MLRTSTAVTEKEPIIYNRKATSPSEVFDCVTPESHVNKTASASTTSLYYFVNLVNSFFSQIGIYFTAFMILFRMVMKLAWSLLLNPTDHSYRKFGAPLWFEINLSIDLIFRIALVQFPLSLSFSLEKPQGITNYSWHRAVNEHFQIHFCKSFI